MRLREGDNVGGGGTTMKKICVCVITLIYTLLELLPFGALSNLIAKMHTITTSKNVRRLKIWMQISLIILCMIDLYKDNHVRACLCACVRAHLLTFSLTKASPQKPLTGLLLKFIVVFLR